MKSSFSFPTNFQTESSGSGYYKLEPGANKFRIVSDPVFGQEYWKTEKDEQGNPVFGENGKAKRKPIRVKLTETVPVSELEVDQWGNPGRVNHFMAMVVYDWKVGDFKIFSSVSKQVNAGIKTLVESEDWGDPKNYDIIINKTGSGRETKYSVMPSAKKPMPDNIMDALKEKTINLDALFTGENPFEPGDAKSKDLPF